MTALNHSNNNVINLLLVVTTGKREKGDAYIRKIIKKPFSDGERLF